MKLQNFTLMLLLGLFVSLGTSCKKGEGEQTEHINTDNTEQNTTASCATIEEINDYVVQINNRMSVYAVVNKTYQNPDQTMYYDRSEYEAYYDGPELMMLVEKGGEEGFAYETRLYICNNQVVYIHSNNYSMHIEAQNGLYQIDKAYMKDGQIFKYWRQAIDPFDTERKFSDAQGDYVEPKEDLIVGIRDIANSALTRFNQAN